MVLDQVIDKAVQKEANMVDSEVTTDLVAELFVNQVGHLGSLPVTLHVDSMVHLYQHHLHNHKHLNCHLYFH